jgi:hypothetical protein
MTRRVMVGVAVAFVLGIVLPLATSAPVPADDKPNADKNSPFAGKVLIVHDHMGAMTVLEGVQIRQLGSKDFLMGKVAADDAGSKGRTRWISIEAVDSITEYDNLKDAKKAYEEQHQPVVPVPVAPPRALPVAPPPAPAPNRS